MSQGKRQPKRQDVCRTCIRIHSIVSQKVWTFMLMLPAFVAFLAASCYYSGSRILALGFVAARSFVKGQMQIEGCNFCYNLFSLL